MSIALSFGSTTLAQSLQDEAIIVCLDIAADEERLACFENLADPLRRAQNGPTKQSLSANKPAPSTTIASKDASTKPLEPTSDFGAEDIKAERDKRQEHQIEKIEAKATKVKTNKFGKVTITLDNGQTWRQLSSDSRKVRLKSDGTPYSIVIRRTSFGGYMLRVNGSKRSIRVQRTK